MRYSAIAMIVSALSLAACGPAPEQESKEPAALQTERASLRNGRTCSQLEANKQLLHNYHVEVWEEGQLDVIPEYLAEDFFSHAVPAGSPQGAEANIQFMQLVRSAFPDLTSHEDALFGEGDRVVIQWTIQGTHQGYFFGMPPTNKTIRVSGMDVLRVRDGKFVEHWGGFGDQVDVIFQQLQQ